MAIRETVILPQASEAIPCRSADSYDLHHDSVIGQGDNFELFGQVQAEIITDVIEVISSLAHDICGVSHSLLE